MPYLKTDAPPEVIDAIQKIESRADACASGLALSAIHSNVASWALLVGGVRLVEHAAACYGTGSLHFDGSLISIGRFVSIALKWICDCGKKPSKLARRRWTDALSAKTEEALAVASGYSTFLGCFPLWHDNRYMAELISPEFVRFTALGPPRQRQVSAHIKGFRPTTGAWKAQRAVKAQQTPQVQEHSESTLGKCHRTGATRFECPDPWDLWLILFPEYQPRVAGITRRPDSLSLGTYTLGQFKQFYAAVLTVCGAHDFLCFRWGQVSGVYPFDSAVMVRSMADWVDLLSTLSGVPPGVSASAIADLTFDFGRSVDLHIHPFVPLDRSTMSIALAPPFPLHSAPDENILRVCSQLRPSAFDVTTAEKQSEMLATLRSRCTRFPIQESMPLPSPLPDIDLLIADEQSSTVVFAEMKWLRKTLRSAEFKDRDAEALKGIAQLQRIQAFIAANPDHLRSIGKLPRALDEYRNVHYVLVLRDHWLWIEPTDGIAVIEFDAFASVLARAADLQSSLLDMLSYGWLPIEGRDFTVRLDRSIVNGVALESEVFYAP